MRLLRLLGYDLRNTLRSKGIRFCLFPLLALGSCFWCRMDLDMIKEQGLRTAESLGDYLFFQLCGVSFYVNEQRFLLPFVWLFLSFYFFFTVADYPDESIRADGFQALFRTGRKWKWWLEKCLWLLVMTVLSFGSVFLVTVLYCAWQRIPLQLDLSENFLLFCYGLGAEDTGFLRENLPLLILLILAAYYVIALVQQTLALFLKPKAALVLTIGAVYVSIYGSHPLLLGNFTMLLRYVGTSSADGITPGNAVLIFGILLVICLAAGCFQLCHRDFLELKE